MNKQNTPTPPIEYVKCHLVLDTETDEIADVRARQLRVNRSMYIRNLIRQDQNREIRRRRQQAEKGAK